MDILKALGLRKKKKKEDEEKEEETSTEANKKDKNDSKKAQESAESSEKPMMTVSRQLTNIRRDLQDMEEVLRGGFQGLRADHHRILEEQIDKDDLEEFKKWTEKRTLTLKNAKNRIENEIEMLKIDRRIVDLVEGGKKRASEIAKELEISRQYASERLNRLVEVEVVEKKREGRKVYYTAE